jgi:hypothetical protein
LYFSTTQSRQGLNVSQEGRQGKREDFLLRGAESSTFEYRGVIYCVLISSVGYATHSHGHGFSFWPIFKSNPTTFV